jgi:PAS domain S-box-containing protein
LAQPPNIDSGLTLFGFCLNLHYKISFQINLALMQNLLHTPEGELYRAAFEKYNSMSEIAVVFDLELRYTLVNDTVCKRLGKTRAEIIGRGLLELHPELIGSVHHTNLLKAISEGKPVIDNMPFTCGNYYSIVYEPIIFDRSVRGVILKSYLSSKTNTEDRRLRSEQKN